MWEKEKLLVTSNFSFFHSVLKSLIMQTSKNEGLFRKGLKKNNVPQTGTSIYFFSHIFFFKDFILRVFKTREVLS